MEANKITPKPLTHADRINKARDISGLRKRMRESRFVGAMITVLGWFTIPAEVFLRRKLGYRWFTPTNFLVGALLMYALTYLQYGADELRYRVANFDSTWNPFYDKNEMPDYVATAIFNSLASYYLVFGVCKLIMRWWRSRTNVELHSYDDGISWLEFLGFMLRDIINLVAMPIIFAAYYFSGSQKRGTDIPRLINDNTAFTNTVIEPAFIISLCYYCPYLFLRIWLSVTGFAVAVHANMKESAKRTRILDFRDSMLEAKAMAALRNGKSEEDKKKPEKTKTESKKPVPDVPPNYPDLRTIIEELHGETYLTIPEDW